MAGRPNLKVLVCADQEYVRWTPGEASYKDRHSDAVAGMYALFGIIPSYRNEIFENFSKHFAYSHFLRTSVRDFRIPLFAARSLGLVNVAKLSLIGMKVAWVKLYEKIRRITDSA